VKRRLADKLRDDERVRPGSRSMHAPSSRRRLLPDKQTPS